MYQHHNQISNNINNVFKLKPLTTQCSVNKKIKIHVTYTS